MYVIHSYIIHHYLSSLFRKICRTLDVSFLMLVDLSRTDLCEESLSSLVDGECERWGPVSLSLSLFRPVYPDEACLKGLSALYSTGSKCLDFCLVHCLKGLFIFSIASVQKCTILNMTFFTIILYLLLRANICFYFILFCYVLSFIKGSLYNTHCINRFQKPATWEFELQVSRKKNSRLSE